MDWKMWIGGEWVHAEKEATYPVTSPFDGSTIATVPKGSRNDARRAIDAAREAFDRGPWPKLPPAPVATCS